MVNAVKYFRQIQKGSSNIFAMAKLFSTSPKQSH